MKTIKESQCAKILRHLINHGSITTAQAYEKFRCFRVSERIRELRKSGYIIFGEMVTTKNGSRCAKYSLL